MTDKSHARSQMHLRSVTLSTIIFNIIIMMTTFSGHTQQPLPEKYRLLPFGAIKPAGWLREQMSSDMQGFVGHLDDLVPDLIHDPIYSSGRLGKHSKAKDLGNLKSGDAEGDEQYKWWNSETQSNWWDGYIRNALLLDDSKAIENAGRYIQQIIGTQDHDGYLGIYDTALRYKFQSENGELWAKTTLFRGMLAWYEATWDKSVLTSVIRAVDNVMVNYPEGRSEPFFAGNDFAGGVAHGLTFTDILDRLYLLTSDQKYIFYATFLYQNYCRHKTSETDAQLQNILDPSYRLQMHGVHTYEHLRPLIVAAWATGESELMEAVGVYVKKISTCTTPAGGAIGDEWIAGRAADATTTGYEYCSLHELMDSYSLLFRKSGDVKAADAMENIFFNAAQGSRNPDHSCIAYLKTDNSYEMTGTRNGEPEPGRNQTRYKYSPAHQDVAVCCAPNAGRITPYFVASTWLMEDAGTLVCVSPAPVILQTKINGIDVKIETITDYPFGNKFRFSITCSKPTQFKVKIRKPSWVKEVVSRENFNTENQYLVINRQFSQKDEIGLEFHTAIRILEDQHHAKYFMYGPLVFAYPINASAVTGKVYAVGFTDFEYRPDDTTRYHYLTDHKATFSNGKINLMLRNKNTGKTEPATLVPMAGTILRQAAFEEE
jgi:DUF1680 family protein